MAGLIPFNRKNNDLINSGFDDFRNMLDDFFADNWPIRRSLAADTFKIDVQDMVQEVKAVSADKKVAQALGIKVKSPVLHIIRRYSTSRPGFYLYSSTYCNTDKYAVSSFN